MDAKSTAPKCSILAQSHIASKGRAKFQSLASTRAWALCTACLRDNKHIHSIKGEYTMMSAEIEGESGHAQGPGCLSVSWDFVL